MRKIKYKKARNVLPTPYEYDGIYTDKKTEMQLFVYNEESVVEFQDITVKGFIEQKDSTKNNWLNLHGLTSTEVIQELAKQLSLNSLIVSDILNISRGTRFDEFDESLFLASNQFCLLTIRIVKFKLNKLVF